MVYDRERGRPTTKALKMTHPFARFLHRFGIMRRTVDENQISVLDRDPGDLSTIEDAGSVEEVRAAWQELRAEVGANR
jgi:hypothetical protein